LRYRNTRIRGWLGCTIMLLGQEHRSDSSLVFTNAGLQVSPCVSENPRLACWKRRTISVWVRVSEKLHRTLQGQLCWKHYFL